MKNLKILIIILLTIGLWSCEKNLMDYIESGEWNSEKSVLNIKFNNQLGAANITRDSITDDGEVSFFYLDSSNSGNMNLEILEMNLSYGATANKKVGDILEFGADSTANLTVTSQNGKSKIWTIRMKTFEDVIIGTWNLQKLWIYGGMAPYYSAVINMVTWDPFKKNSLPASKEMDNTLTFTLEGALANGNSFGTIVNDPGPDGLFADFIFSQSGDTIDVNHFYRKIPTGVSKWSKDVSKNTITFTPLDGGASSTCDYVEAGTYQLDANRSITLTDIALRFNLDQPGVLETRGTRRNYAVDSVIKFFIEIKKQ